MTTLVMGVDASTTAVKANLFDLAGRCVSSGHVTIPLHNPEPGGWEQQADDWWRALCSAAKQATDGVSPEAIAGVCLAVQRETAVVVDGDGLPLGPALVWMDERCKPQVDVVRRSGRADRIHRLSGKPVCTTPSVYKIQWLRKHRPAHFAGVHKVLDVHGFLTRRLLGRSVTTPAAADPTGLIDVTTGEFCDELLQMAGLHLDQVAELAPVGALVGRISSAAAADCGLAVGTRVFGGGGDGQLAGLGAGVVTPYEAYLNLGTALVSGVCSEVPRFDLAFRTLCGACEGRWVLETDLKGGTFTLDWLCRFLGVPDDQKNDRLSALEAEAECIPPGSDGLVVLPYWCGVMNPYWDDAASGTLLGLRGHHRPAHLYRAILEGLALEQRLHIQGVSAAIKQPLDRVVVVGGGAQRPLWRQIMADVLALPLTQPTSTESTSLGAAIVAAVGAGLHPGLEVAVKAMSHRGPTTEPGSASGYYQQLYSRVFTKIYPALEASFGALDRLQPRD